MKVDLAGYFQVGLDDRTRDAAAHFQKEVELFMKSCGVGRWRHKTRGARVSTHSDDFFVSAAAEGAMWFQEKLQGRFEVGCLSLEISKCGQTLAS